MSLRAGCGASWLLGAKDMAELRGRDMGDPCLPTMPTSEGSARQSFENAVTAAGLLG